MSRTRLFLLSTLLAFVAAGCGPRDDTAPAADLPAADPPVATQPGTAAAGNGATGTATVYAAMHEGRQTASGETFNHDELVAAHRTHEMGSQVRVTNLENDRSVTVRIVDRMGTGTDAVIDLSRRAAQELGIDEAGTARVRVEPL